MPENDKPTIRCYGIIPFDKEFHSLKDAIIAACARVGAILTFPTERVVRPMLSANQTYLEIARCDLIIADVSRPNPNIFYEIGLAHALGKPAILLMQEEKSREVPFDVRSYPYLAYSMTPDGLANFRQKFRRFLEEFIRSPRSFNPLFPFPQRFVHPPYIVDLEKIAPREFENLCFELIAQMGFRKVEWGKEFREIDVVATLPKKDPDGYEYQELWLISMGRRAPVGEMLNMAVMDPEYFLHRMLRYPEGLEELFSKYKIRYDVPITILFILREEETPPELFEQALRKMERRSKDRPYPFTIRVRWWDQSYLTNLIQQYPQIAFKYFSEEARVKSKYLFSWDAVPGNDDERLLKFLKDDLKIEWTENAEIRKSNNNKEIIIKTENNSLIFKINEKEKKVNLEITGGGSYEYHLEEEKGKLNVYKSKYRKTPEEMYKENVMLNERLQITLNALEEEKKRRFIAERDAAWKDVAFKAAHKLGNPIDAIDTSLQSLKKRINNNCPNEVLQIANNMDISLEEAKKVIEQFKSLVKSQKIIPVLTDILPLIQHACKTAEEKGVIVSIKTIDNCPQIMIDPDKIAECFNELVANALHWFDKSDKKIMISVDKPSIKELQETLDETQEYLKIHFEDNGCGVPFENKEKIFAPFFTTYTHGTGIGLSLVKSIIEGHGGQIYENGKPGEGSSFEIYLHIAKKQGKYNIENTVIVDNKKIKIK